MGVPIFAVNGYGTLTIVAFIISSCIFGWQPVLAAFGGVVSGIFGVIFVLVCVAAFCWNVINQKRRATGAGGGDCAIM